MRRFTTRSTSSSDDPSSTRSRRAPPLAASTSAIHDPGEHFGVDFGAISIEQARARVRTDPAAEREADVAAALTRAGGAFASGRAAPIDPTQVRIHRGREAERAAALLDARAFAVGSEIVLGGNATADTLAHELAHVALGHTANGAIARQPLDAPPSTHLATRLFPWSVGKKLDLDLVLASAPAVVEKRDDAADEVQLRVDLPVRMTIDLVGARGQQALHLGLALRLAGGESWRLPFDLPDVPLAVDADGNVHPSIPGAPEGLIEFDVGEGAASVVVRVPIVKSVVATPLSIRRTEPLDVGPDVKTRPVVVSGGLVDSIQELFPFTTGSSVQFDGAMDGAFTVGLVTTKRIALLGGIPVQLDVRGDADASGPALFVSASVFGRSVLGATRIAVKHEGAAYALKTPFGEIRVSPVVDALRILAGPLQVGALGGESSRFPAPAPWNLGWTPSDPRGLDPQRSRSFFGLPPLGLEFDEPWPAATDRLVRGALDVFPVASRFSLGNLGNSAKASTDARRDVGESATDVPSSALVAALSRFLTVRRGVRIEPLPQSVLVAPTVSLAVAVPLDTLTLHGSLGIGAPTDMGSLLMKPEQAINLGAYVDLAVGQSQGSWSFVFRGELGTRSAPDAALLVYQWHTR